MNDRRSKIRFVRNDRMPDANRDYLLHYGVKGMKWGEVKEEEFKPRTYLSAYSPQKMRTSGGSAKTSRVTHKTGAPNSRVVRSQTKQNASIKNVDSSKPKDRISVKDTTGRFGRGNIDLNKRQVVRNKDGTISTERSFSVNIDGKETLLPTVVGGRIVTEDEAIDHYYNTGEHLGRFDTVEEAEEYAEQLHNRQDWYYNEYKPRIDKVKKIGATFLKKLLKSLGH